MSIPLIKYHFLNMIVLLKRHNLTKIIIFILAPWFVLKISKYYVTADTLLNWCDLALWLKNVWMFFLQRHCLTCFSIVIYNLCFFCFRDTARCDSALWFCHSSERWRHHPSRWKGSYVSSTTWVILPSIHEVWHNAALLLVHRQWANNKAALD